MGGGVFELGNPEGRGAQAVLEIQVKGGGGKKLCLPSRGCGFFSGITQCLPSPSLIMKFEENPFSELKCHGLYNSFSSRLE